MHKIIILLIILLILPSFCFAQDKAKDNQEVNGFSLAQYEEDGGKKWKLNGRSAEVEKGFIKIDEISAVAFGETTTLKLKAKEASLDREAQLVHLEDEVVMKTTDGTSLTTHSLDWDARRKNVFTTEPVTIRKSDFEVNGKGAEFNLENKTAELRKDIVANIGSSDASFLRTTIICDGPLVINYNKHQATFRNNVKVEDAQGDIFADRIDVYFNRETRRVRCVVARGNVKIVNNGNITYSERAIYLVEQGRVILPRRPKLVINEKGTHGEQ